MTAALRSLSFTVSQLLLANELTAQLAVELVVSYLQGGIRRMIDGRLLHEEKFGSI